jgi:hypothetical protein
MSKSVTDPSVEAEHTADPVGLAFDEITEDDVRNFRAGFTSSGAHGPIYDKSVKFGLACFLAKRGIRLSEQREARTVTMTPERIAVLEAMRRGLCEKWVGVVPCNAIVLAEILAEVRE